MCFWEANFEFPSILRIAISLFGLLVIKLLIFYWMSSEAICAFSSYNIFEIVKFCNG